MDYGEFVINYSEEEFFRKLKMQWLNHRDIWHKKNACPTCGVRSVVPLKRSFDCPITGFYCKECGWILMADRKDSFELNNVSA